MTTNDNQALTMSNKEANRISVIDHLIKKEIKQKQAAKILDLSIRQIKRLIRKYRKQGIISLVHGNRGKISNHSVGQKEIDRVLEIVKTNYFDFGPTLAFEKLTRK